MHWDYKTHALTVKVDVDGLAPNSVHPNHIHLGVCSSNGPVKYPLKNIVANGEGDASATTVIQGVTGGIPASGWYLNIHHGPGLATADQMAAIYCGNIANLSVKSNHDQDVTITLHQLVLNGFTAVSKIDSTVPANGDVNPYGVAVVQKSVGNLVKGHILVSNFNSMVPGMPRSSRTGMATRQRSSSPISSTGLCLRITTSSIKGPLSASRCMFRSRMVAHHRSKTQPSSPRASRKRPIRPRW